MAIKNIDLNKLDIELNENKIDTKKTVKYSNLIYTVVMSIVFVFFMLIMYHQYRVHILLNMQISNINEQITEQQAINDALNKEMDFKDTPEFVERIAREKLGMVKPNEIVFVDENK